MISKARCRNDTNAVTSEDVLEELVPKYTADTTIFICPGGRDSQIPSGEPLRNHKISYAYFMGRRLDASAIAAAVRPADQCRAEARGGNGVLAGWQTARATTITNSAGISC